MTDYDALVKRYVELDEQRTHIVDELEGIKSQLRTLEPGKHDIAGCSVSIVPNRRIDEAKVATLYPVATHPELYTAKPDTKKLRNELPAKVVDSLMNEVGQPKVSVS